MTSLKKKGLENGKFCVIKCLSWAGTIFEVKINFEDCNSKFLIFKKLSEKFLKIHFEVRNPGFNKMAFTFVSIFLVTSKVC